MENFITNISILKDEINDDDIYPLLKSSETFFNTVKYREMSLSKLEKEYIHYLLHKYNSKSRVDKILKIARKSLYNKLKNTNNGDEKD